MALTSMTTTIGTTTTGGPVGSRYQLSTTVTVDVQSMTSRAGVIRKAKAEVKRIRKAKNVTRGTIATPTPTIERKPSSRVSGLESEPVGRGGVMVAAVIEDHLAPGGGS